MLQGILKMWVLQGGVPYIYIYTDVGFRVYRGYIGRYLGEMYIHIYDSGLRV